MSKAHYTPGPWVVLEQSVLPMVAHLHPGLPVKEETWTGC